MITFKQFLEAEGNNPGAEQFGAAQRPRQLKGSLTDNEKRVLAILSTNQVKTSPGLARNIISGESNMVQSVKTLKTNFKAVDVTPDGITINQNGITLATNQGIVDPNSGELTPVGNQLVATRPNGEKNPKTQSLLNQTEQQPQPSSQSIGF
jgi:hypothetical protein